MQIWKKSLNPEFVLRIGVTIWGGEVRLAPGVTIFERHQLNKKENNDVFTIIGNVQLTGID